ncbi:MAG: mechanosensitive ion channel [Bacteroidetes bacterium]|jgi:small-conductance mechanosensitive channel|nr:mechanosensitive ion channel [Bacteroidota bacterium]
MTQTQWIYLTIVIAAGSFIIWLALKTITRFKRRRLSRLDDIEDYNPVNTIAPPGITDGSTLANAAKNIQGRFSIIRRSAIVLGISLLLPLLVVPFISYLPIASISVVISAFGIILGIAARPIIENFISGILLSFSSNVHLGDTVIVDGYYGVIEDITMLHTSIKTWDWKRYVLSNSDMLNKQMVNFSVREPYIWSYVEFWISPSADLPTVRDTALRVAGQYTSSQIKEAPRFWVIEMGKTAIKCWVATWSDSAAQDWNTKHNIRTELVMELAKQGIGLHLNQIEVENKPSLYH